MKKQVSEKIKLDKYGNIIKKMPKEKPVCNFCGRKGVALHPITHSCIKCGVLPERT